MPFEVRAAGREPCVYAPMCMYCPVCGLVCCAPIHPARAALIHLATGARHDVGWLVRARSIATAARVGNTHARACSMDPQNVRGGKPTHSRGCVGLGSAARHASIGVEGSRSSVWSSGTARGHRYVGVCTGRGADMREDDPGSPLAAHRRRSLHGLCMANTRRLSYQLARRYIHIDACKSLTLQLRRR